MTEKNSKNFETKIAVASLQLIGAHGWDKVTLERIAKVGKLSLAQIKTLCVDKQALLALLVRHITRETCAASAKPSATVSLHDRLFDVMMARFDVLQANRQAILSIMASLPRQPKLGLILFRAQIRAMDEVQKHIGMTTNQTCARLSPFVMAAIYAHALRLWRYDETLDMSKTMAGLDQALRLAIRIAILLRVDVARI